MFLRAQHSSVTHSTDLRLSRHINYELRYCFVLWHVHITSLIHRYTIHNAFLFSRHKIGFLLQPRVGEISDRLWLVPALPNEANLETYSTCIRDARAHPKISSDSCGGVIENYSDGVALLGRVCKSSM